MAKKAREAIESELKIRQRVSIVSVETNWKVRLSDGRMIPVSAETSAQAKALAAEALREG